MSSSWTRRQLMQTVLVGGAGLTLGRMASARSAAVSETPLHERAIELHNTHTSETVSVVYRRGAEYVDRAVASLRHVMRDHRNDEAHDIDVALYDQLYELAQSAHCDARFEIISGYRSPESNAAMAALLSGDR